MKAQVGDTPENLHKINRQSHSSPFYVVQAHWLTSSAFHLLYYYYYYCYYYWKPDLEILTLNIVTSQSFSGIFQRHLEVRTVQSVSAPFIL